MSETHQFMFHPDVAPLRLCHGAELLPASLAAASRLLFHAWAQWRWPIKPKERVGERAVGKKRGPAVRCANLPLEKLLDWVYKEYPEMATLALRG